MCSASCFFNIYSRIFLTRSVASGKFREVFSGMYIFGSLAAVWKGSWYPFSNWKQEVSHNLSQVPEKRFAAMLRGPAWFDVCRPGRQGLRQLRVRQKVFDGAFGFICWSQPPQSQHLEVWCWCRDSYHAASSNELAIVCNGVRLCKGVAV